MFFLFRFYRNTRTREAYPDGEFILGKYAISSPHFHPYRVFKSLGIENPKQVLKIYVDGFTSLDSTIHSSNEVHARSLTKQMVSFHLNGWKDLDRYFSCLKITGIFDDFFQRFCSIPNLPTLITKKTSQMLGSSSIFSYCEAVLYEELPLIGQLSEKQLDLVRIRRLIQSRAYYGYSLLKVLLNEEVYEIRNHKIPFANLITLTRIYLDMLEKALHLLVSELNPSSILKKINSCDLFYQKNILKKFRSHTFWVTKRPWIGPPFPGQTHPGPLKEGEKVNKEDLQHLLAWLLRTLSKIKISDRDELFWTHSNLISSLFENVTTLKKSRQQMIISRKFSKVWNEIIFSKYCRRNWSVDLGETSPLENNFRELIFKYI